MRMKVKTRLVSLPIEELRYYRSLRAMGIPREEANYWLVGRFTIHRHGSFSLKATEVVA